MTFSPFTTVAIVFAAGIALYELQNRVSLYLSSSHIPGPSHPLDITGNLKETGEDERGTISNRWMDQYGRIFATWALFGTKEIFLGDLKAVAHVLKHEDTYEKSGAIRYLLGRIAGQGLLVTEGATHKRQRRIMNPAFGPAQIRTFTPIFFEKSIALRDAWGAFIDPETSAGRIDVLSWLGRTTLDIIGHAGFDYQFNAISGEQNKLSEAYAHMFESGNHLDLLVIFKLLFPWAMSLPEHSTSIRRAQVTTSNIGRDLLKQAREAAKNDKPQDRDLLSLLIKSNMSTDIPEDQRISDDDVLAQVPTFLAAGHETTSTSTAWALYLLASNPEAQQKLRLELAPIQTESPSMDELNALPYLETVVRETLRILAPVPTTARVATRDDVIPLSEPFIDVYGRKQRELRVKKGQDVVIPILGLNRDKALWGEDAEEFRPERWDNLPEAVSQIPGVWGNMMTFLGGGHACIGWRFALVEMKALLFTLIRAYEFDLAVPKDDVLVKRAFPVNRPVVRNSKVTNELPMIVRPVVG